MTENPTALAGGPAPLDKDTLKERILRYARYSLGCEWTELSRRERFLALSLAIREPIIDAMLESERRARASRARRVYYLSMEFLCGRVLGNNLLNTGLRDVAEEALRDLGEDLAALEELEPDPALGNGGLGRLAACFLDSMATLGIHGYGYGINYEFGLFKQHFRDGHQRELPDEWRSSGTPWLLHRPDQARLVRLFGRVEPGGKRRFREAREWVGGEFVVGVPSDLPVVGYGGHTVNHLRLYAARASEEFDIEIFNSGDYVDAVRRKIDSERISKVLYPSDDIDAGKELRLIQEYFFVSCALQDILDRHAPDPSDVTDLPERAAVQLNDTHPSLAIPELIRLLVDERGVDFDEAVEITRRTCSYTNHTLLPEALERWPVKLLKRVLPRHLEIVLELNHAHLEGLADAIGDDDGRRRRLSIIEEDGERTVRMGHLAVVGCHAINGVSKLHSSLVRTRLFPDFAAIWPERFMNKTNGVTQRRWILHANPELSELLTELVGPGWITDLDRVRALSDRREDASVLDRLARIKRAHKERLAARIRELCDVEADPESLFDVHIKRLHEYKRQLLNAMRILYEYLRLVEDGVEPEVPRTYVFGGKAAPGYARAKEIIKLIHEVARLVNNDPRASAWMRVAFIPDYRVTLAERIIPAADVSEQISTAGMEASGTGNMKFMMNGALTVGTLDGANIEMLDACGADNMFVFGLTAEEIDARRAAGYDPASIETSSEPVRRVLEAIGSDRLCEGGAELFGGLIQDLRQRDPYFVLADFESFLDTQRRVSHLYRDPRAWQAKCLLNIAASGRFSSDRTIREYARDIWGVAPVRSPLEIAPA